MTKHDRFIFTKHGRISIPDDLEGTPIEEAWPNTKIPDDLKGSLICSINGKDIIARQDFEED